MLDEVRIAFDPNSQRLLNIILATMMFGVSLGLKPADFTRVFRAPKAPLSGLVAQFMLLPALTCLLTVLVPMDPGIALGMILVASCPGGSFSNVMTWMSRGNVAVSVSMTATSSVAALIFTPLNFTFWGSVNPGTRELLSSIQVDGVQILQLIVMVLGIPLLLGMLVGNYLPAISARIEPWLKKLSLLIFLLFVGIALGNNGELFLQYFTLFAGFVILHNAVALSIGWSAGQLLKLPTADRRAVMLEVGIQNSGLGLIILFNFFPNQGGMMIITAFWGVWHLVSGLTLAGFWARRDHLALRLP